MANVEWIKLTVDMFDNRKIKHIRKLPEGNNIVLIWIMLLTMAGRCNSNGFIFLTENIPYTHKMLADELGFDESVIKVALAALEKFNMIHIDGELISIRGWQKYQNIEGLDKVREQTRKRVADFRERQKQVKQLPCNDDEIETFTTKTCVTVSKDINDAGQTEILQIVKKWNELKVLGIKPVLKISNKSKRYRSLIARIREYGIDCVLSAIDKIKESNYCQGKNKYNWIITFDWFVLPNNFPKVLEGNYDNRKVKTNESGRTTKKYDHRLFGESNNAESDPDEPLF